MGGKKGGKKGSGGSTEPQQSQGQSSSSQSGPAAPPPTRPQAPVESPSGFAMGRAGSLPHPQGAPGPPPPRHQDQSKSAVSQEAAQPTKRQEPLKPQKGEGKVPQPQPQPQGQSVPSPSQPQQPPAATDSSQPSESSGSKKKKKKKPAKDKDEATQPSVSATTPTPAQAPVGAKSAPPPTRPQAPIGSPPGFAVGSAGSLPHPQGALGPPLPRPQDQSKSAVSQEAAQPTKGEQPLKPQKDEGKVSQPQPQPQGESASTQPQPQQPLAATDASQSSESSGSKKKKKKKPAQGKDEATQPSAAATTTAAPAQGGPSTSGLQTKKGGEIKKGDTKGAGDAPIDSFKKLTVSGTQNSYRIPPRIVKKKHDMKTCVASNKIEVNYLPLTIHNWNLDLYHYDVTFVPDKPKSLLRRAVDVFVRQNFRDRHPAFDGRKNLYAAKTHLFPHDSIRNTVQVPDPEDGNRLKTFDITIKKTLQRINLKQLKEYIERGKSQEIPQDVIQATDIALRAGLYDNFIPCARSFFSGPMKEQTKLSGGMELYDGFFQSAIMGKAGAFLNVDVSNKAFPIDQPVLTYMQNEMMVDLKTELDPEKRKSLQDFLRGLKIRYVVQGERRTYRVNGLGHNAFLHKFTPEGKPEMNVVQYFSSVKRINLKYPNLPLLHVGPSAKNTMIPIEFCWIIGRQVVMRKLDPKQTDLMVRAAARPTTERKMRIMSSITNARYQDNEVLTKEFGITVNTRFHQVDSWVFKPPTIRYNQKTAFVNNGVWRTPQQDKFNIPVMGGITKWAVLSKDFRTDASVLENPKFGLVPFLITAAKDMGIVMSPVKEILHAAKPYQQTQASIEKELEMLNKKHDGLQIVVVILGNNKDAYGNVKRASEFRCGVLTQCVKANTALKKMSLVTAGNIILKIHAKVNGTNHRIDESTRPPVFTLPVMFVGADVTHPAPGPDAEGTPSIAAVAASFDPAGFKYKMMYRLQGSRQEIIEDLAAMMVEQLKHFQQKCNKKLPLRILYYRDGVSEGQFSQVLHVELDALKRACTEFEGYQPRITFLVVQKRHHTRFFPDLKSGDKTRNNNVLAGTVVDTDITHPTETDFYLVSHQSIQGTARPTKYHVLFDENQFDCEELEILTYYLCYLFARCTRSVSYPAPTYYAHLAAFRARAWWDGQNLDMRNLRRDQTERGTLHPAIGNGNPMFFV